MPINHAKLDPNLIIDIQRQNDEERKTVWVDFSTVAIPNDSQREILKGMRVNNYDRPKLTFGAKLSLKEIEVLSNEPWVKRMWALPHFVP